MEPELRIIKLKPRDRSEFERFLGTLDSRTIENYGRWDYDFFISNTSSIVKSCCKEKNGLVAIEDMDGIIGYAHLSFAQKASRKHSCGFGIVISPDYQNSGVGTKLMEETIMFAKEFGIKKIWLHVYDFNEPAIKLYNKFGFEQEGRFKKEEKKNGKYVDVISMAKFL